MAQIGQSLVLGFQLWVSLVVWGCTLAAAGPAALPATAPAETPTGVQEIQIIDWTKVHDVGAVHVLVTNWGLVGSRPGSAQPYSNEPSVRWPAASMTDYLWSGGFWIGAYKNGERGSRRLNPRQRSGPAATELDRSYVTRQGAHGGSLCTRPMPTTIMTGGSTRLARQS